MLNIESVKHLQSIELIRDGGSLAACYIDEYGAEFWLLFKVKREDGDWKPSDRSGCESASSTRVGYEEPVIVKRHSSTPAEATSWSEAQAFLRELEPALPEARASSVKWWGAMLRVAESNGAALPDDSVLGATFLLQGYRRAK